MGHLRDEERTAMSVLFEQGHSQSAVARLLAVSEGTVRYHRKRMKGAVVDGRSKQVPKAAAFSDGIETWRSQQAGGRINLALLHDWLSREHGYTGSLKSVQRYWKRTYPAPKIRARRRVETPPGAQAQVDWVEFPGVTLGREEVDLVALIVTLSWSRKRAVVWARGKDMLSWQSCQIGCLQRLGGVPAVLRIDNVKTAIATGGGSWGKINEVYRRFATQLRFHVDACQPRHPQGKGKVERHAQDLRVVVDPRNEHFGDLATLQAATDIRLEDRFRALTCPVTGTSIADAWEQERRLLTPLPAAMPEPFDVVVYRPVGVDCMVSFEGRRYSVPFRFVGQQVEVRGLAGRVQVFKDASVVADHARSTAELLLRDEAHYEGENTDRVLAPMPLGRMGRRMQEIAASGVQHRSLDLYARLAEVAR
jgi:transposase